MPEQLPPPEKSDVRFVENRVELSEDRLVLPEQGVLLDEAGSLQAYGVPASLRAVLEFPSETGDVADARRVGLFDFGVYYKGVNLNQNAPGLGRAQSRYGLLALNFTPDSHMLGYAPLTAGESITLGREDEITDYLRPSYKLGLVRKDNVNKLVSRKHIDVMVDDEGVITLQDRSLNGTIIEYPDIVKEAAQLPLTEYETESSEDAEDLGDEFDTLGSQEEPTEVNPENLDEYVADPEEIEEAEDNTEELDELRKELLPSIEEAFRTLDKLRIGYSQLSADFDELSNGLKRAAAQIEEAAYSRQPVIVHDLEARVGLILEGVRRHTTGSIEDIKHLEDDPNTSPREVGARLIRRGQSLDDQQPLLKRAMVEVGDYLSQNHRRRAAGLDEFDREGKLGQLLRHLTNIEWHSVNRSRYNVEELAGTLRRARGLTDELDDLAQINRSNVRQSSEALEALMHQLSKKPKK